MATFRTSPSDVTVGQELASLRIKILLRFLRFKRTFFIQVHEELLGVLMVLLARGAAVMVKANPKLFEGTAHHCVVTVHHLLRGDALVFRLNSDRYTMLVRATNELHIPTPHSHIAHVDVRRQIAAGQVTNVDGTVGVRQSCRDHDFFVRTHVD